MPCPAALEVEVPGVTATVGHERMEPRGVQQ